MTAEGTDPLAPFAERWAIAARPAGLHVWTADQTSDDGRHIRYIVAPTPGELAVKLENAEAGR
jgi:hypothetical protein